MRILIVEDNEDYRELLTEAFSDRGWEVASAPDGKAGLKMIPSLSPEVILSDVLMPHLDGFHLLHEVRKSGYSTMLFIFYTSAYGKDEHRDFALKQGADAYIVKPLDLDKMVALVEKIAAGSIKRQNHEAVEENEFLRSHDVILSEKVVEEMQELQDEMRRRRKAEEELARLKRKEEGVDNLPAPVCPLDVSEDLTEPVNEIETRCREILEYLMRKGATDALTIVSQVCDATKQLRESVESLSRFIVIPRSEAFIPVKKMSIILPVLKKNYAAALGEKSKELSEIEHFLQEFSISLDDLVRLASLARAEAKRTSADLTEIARSIADELKEAKPDRHVEFHIQEGLTAHADRQMMRVALGHLIDNAWKFTSRRSFGQIRFGKTMAERTEAFFVRDNGIGFEMECSDAIFSAFHRLHSAEEYPGKGIGLAIVKTIIDRHGGRIWAVGEPGAGATIYFTLKAL